MTQALYSESSEPAW